MSRTARIGIGLMMALGLALRILAARGGLWLDEAWSVVMARQAAPVIGVFASINHDNNHHLNSLWLQLWAPTAPSVALRALSIAASTATIGVVGLLGARRSPATGIALAALFATSPVMLVYGSEARGYAPMLLALALAIAIADRAERMFGRAPRYLAMVAGAGTLAHLMFAPALLVTAGWAMARQRGGNLMERWRATVALWLPALLTSAVIIAIVLGVAWRVAGGLAVGNYAGFDLRSAWIAFSELVAVTTGAGWLGLAVILALAVVAAGPRTALAGLAILQVGAFPLAVLLLHPGNSGYPRYYLLTAFGLLMLAGSAGGALLTQKGPRRWIGEGLIAILLCASLAEDARQIAYRRGAPERAIAAMAALSPHRAEIALDFEQGRAVIRVAADQAHYRVDFVGCQRAQFRYAERFAGPPIERRCGRIWRQIAEGGYRAPSGEAWRLYVAKP